MTIILIAALIFTIGLTLVLMFRSVIQQEDEFDRRIAEIMHDVLAHEEDASSEEERAAGGLPEETEV